MDEISEWIHDEKYELIAHYIFVFQACVDTANRRVVYRTFHFNALRLISPSRD